jgi:hypothetical protein
VRWEGCYGAKEGALQIRRGSNNANIISVKELLIDVED